jgi:hypothetical protein
MRKPLIAICLAIIFVFLFSSCVETFRGNYGVVENVELVHTYRDMEEPEFKYRVTISHEGNNCGCYKILTNEEYHPGDSIKIGLSKK